MNGCLADFGYRPGLPQEIHDLRQRNAILKEEGRKLFEDNRSLAHLIHMQNERMTQLSSATDQSRMIHELQAQVQAMHAERHELFRRMKPITDEVIFLRQEVRRLMQFNGVLGAHANTPLRNSQVHVARSFSNPATPSPGTIVARSSPVLPGYYQSTERHPRGPSLARINTAVSAPIEHRHHSTGLHPSPVSSEYRTAPSTPATDLTELHPLAILPMVPAEMQSHAASPSVPSQSHFPLMPVIKSLPCATSPSEYATSSSIPNRSAEPHTALSVSKGVTGSTLPAASMLFEGADCNTLPSIPSQKTSIALPVSPVMPIIRSQRSTSPSIPPREAKPEPISLLRPPKPAKKPRAHARTISASLAADVIDLTLDDDSDDDRGARKKRRVGDGPPLTATSNAPAEQPAAAPTSEPMAVDEQQQFLQDCVEANFDEDEDEDEDEKLWCRMCRSRHLAGATQDAPKPFVNATLEDLVQHCEREHPKGWELLKHHVQQHRDSE
ncbi:hypothetical protein AcW2_006061 [Taiwanofungus camphoratus]|nr:hypothetical protein AcW2_006061 [Antrodia cinnamomea]